MPYITKKRRRELTVSFNPKTAGELNYAITILCLDYLENHKEKYQVYNDIIGALECSKLEMYRRKIAVYEEKKKNENGDVY